MEPFHHLAADADAPPEDVALAQAKCALALGRLDGLLAGLTETEKALLSTGLLRAILLSALAQAGFTDAEVRFNAWFAGLGRVRQGGVISAVAVGHRQAALAVMCRG
jgi:hypothetical protein